MSTIFRDHFGGGIDTSLWTAAGSPTTSGNKATLPAGSSLTSVPSMPAGAEFHFDIRFKSVADGSNYYSNVVCANIGDTSLMHFDLYVGKVDGDISYVNVQPVLPLHGGVGVFDLKQIPAKYWQDIDGDLFIRDFNFYVEDHQLSLLIGNHKVADWTDPDINSVEAPFYFMGANIGVPVELSNVSVKTDSGRNI